MTRNAIPLLLLGAMALPAMAEPVNFRLDPDHTFVYFEVLRLGTTTDRGRFDRKGGSVTLDRAAKTGKADIVLEIDSLNTGVPAFTGVVKGKNFLNAAEFPTAKFVGDRFSFEGDKVAAVDGMLTLAGKTNPVKLSAMRFNCYESTQLKREVCGGDFETTIQRSQWGLTGASAFVAESVRLLVSIEGIRE